MINPEDMKVDVPVGQSGEWSIDKFTVSREESERTKLRAMLHGGRGFVPDGEYTRLIRDRSGVIMSDTPDECRDHIGFVSVAEGRVLVGGLGIGLVLKPLLENSDVDAVTVIEIEPDVIELVGNHYTSRYGDRLKIIQADVREWKPKPDDRYFSCWLDIWNDICGDNFDEMKKLNRKFKRWCSRVDCWCFVETARAASGRY